MKKFWLFLIIVIIFISLFLMPMAWGVPDADDIAQFERDVEEMHYKDGFFLPASDRLEFMKAPAESKAGKLYKLFLEKKEKLPLINDLNWAERLYYEHELHQHGWQKAAAQIEPK